MNGVARKIAVTNSAVKSVVKSTSKWEDLEHLMQKYFGDNKNTLLKSTKNNKCCQEKSLDPSKDCQSNRNLVKSSVKI